MHPYRMSPQGVGRTEETTEGSDRKMDIFNLQFHLLGRLSSLSPKRTEESACVWTIGR